MPPIGARAWRAGEQAQHMAGKARQRHAARQRRGDVRRQTLDCRMRVDDCSPSWIDQQIDAALYRRRLVGRPPEHDPIDMFEMQACLIKIGNAAIDANKKVGMARL